MTGLKMMGNNNGLAKAITVDDTGRLSIENKTRIIKTFEFGGGSNAAASVDGAKTLVIDLNNPDKNPRVLYVEVNFGDGFKPINLIDENRILRTDPAKKSGFYYVDVSGADIVRLVASSSTITATAKCYLLTSDCPQPIDTPVKYKRISASDGLITDNFRAIIPITDITLHGNTRLSDEFGKGNTEDLDVFETGDVILAGQTLFGPFQRVRLMSGTALLVLI